MRKIINKLFEENTVKEEWGPRDSLVFDSIYGDETCNECGAEASGEYCKHCTPHMEE